jgi:hypothetical protein
MKNIMLDYASTVLAAVMVGRIPSRQIPLGGSTIGIYSSRGYAYIS